MTELPSPRPLAPPPPAPSLILHAACQPRAPRRRAAGRHRRAPAPGQRRAPRPAAQPPRPAGRAVGAGPLTGAGRNRRGGGRRAAPGRAVPGRPSGERRGRARRPRSPGAAGSGGRRGERRALPARREAGAARQEPPGGAGQPVPGEGGSRGKFLPDSAEPGRGPARPRRLLGLGQEESRARTPGPGAGGLPQGRRCRGPSPRARSEGAAELPRPAAGALPRPAGPAARAPGEPPGCSPPPRVSARRGDKPRKHNKAKRLVRFPHGSQSPCSPG